VALIVEDGTNVSGADALASLAFVDTYHSSMGNTAWTGDDTIVKEPAIRRATAFLSNSYNWKGNRVNGRDQALAWPRAGVVDQDGYGIGSNEIPTELQNAVAEIALRELVTPGTMNPDFTQSAMVKREKVASLEVEYLNSSTSADAQRPVLLVVRDMISQFLVNGGTNRFSGRTVRA